MSRVSRLRPAPAKLPVGATRTPARQQSARAPDAFVAEGPKRRKLAAASLVGTAPGFSLSRGADRVELEAGKAAGDLGRVTVELEGRRLEVTCTRGRFNEYAVSKGLPPGWGVEARPLDAPPVSSLTLYKDPPGTVSVARALRAAQAGIVEYLRRGGLEESGLTAYLDGWRPGDPVPQRLLDGAAHFGRADHPDDPSRGFELFRFRDHYTFAGTGPSGMLTEVDVDKRTGEVTRVMIEVD